MSYELVFANAKRIEALLRQLGYEGRGLHELVTSAGDALPHDVARAARKIATIRNKLAHEDGFVLSADALQSFRESAAFVIEELEAALDRANAARQARADAPGPHWWSDDTEPTWKKVAKIGGVVVGVALLALLGSR
ncbi:hypothetical protein L602_000600000680 [Cupriavidus gilardii J11]|uniref:DUF4145 domain-containing protein n=1 Tax=Cupriavidus gilardii J11 TaxID=936133 RepID=A0A562B3S8_9BURK|nr:hypothetical protein [Cupriavidus gilardii]TWG79668.1 hypothetical protein L602_000600000680 [Cupriavidus gilardii J11]